jgi:hypothetical protein
MSEWQPIGSAPKKKIIEITALEPSGEPFEIHLMQWGADAENPFFAPGVTGMWVAPCGSYTWREGEGGPTHWRMPAYDA